RQPLAGGAAVRPRRAGGADRPPPAPGARGPPGQGGRARDSDRRLGSRRVGWTDGRGGRGLLLLLRGGRAALDLERERCTPSPRLLALAGRRALPRGERPLGVALDADQGGRAGSAGVDVRLSAFLECCCA